MQGDEGSLLRVSSRSLICTIAVFYGQRVSTEHGENRSSGEEVNDMPLKNCPGPYFKKRMRSLRRVTCHFSPLCAAFSPCMNGLFSIRASCSRIPSACRHRSHSLSTTSWLSHIILSELRYSVIKTSRPGPAFTIAGFHPLFATFSVEPSSPASFSCDSPVLVASVSTSAVAPVLCSAYAMSCLHSLGLRTLSSTMAYNPRYSRSVVLEKSTG